MEKIGLNISKIHIARWDEIPNIELYMDQVLNYLEEILANYIKTDEEERIATKTMINNYVKHEIIASPINKKYNKLHIAELIVICILKQVYSINDIKKVIKLGIDTSSAETSYNKFCDYLEEALQAVFKKEKFPIDVKKMTKEEYILKNIVQSFANKLYVQITYLKK